MEYISKNFEETKEIGKNLGKSLKAGDTVTLLGELGAGKTTFISGLASGLEIAEPITSPSFIIVNEYHGRPASPSGGLPFYHVDLYRLNSLEEIEELGIEEYFNKNGVVAIEWAERLGKFMPLKYIEVKIEILSQRERKIEINKLC